MSHAQVVTIIFFYFNIQKVPILNAKTISNIQIQEIPDNLSKSVK